MPISLEQFTKNLADSGVMTNEGVASFIAALPAEAKPADGEQLAKRLVKEKKISAYQAQVVYSGKGKSLTMGGYFVLDKLGQGGMGMVLKAEHRMMKRLVAIKVLSPAVTKTKESMQRFQREVEAAARLTHPNIVGAFDAGESNGSPFLVMEYVPGDDLSAIVKKKGPLAVDQAIDCIVQAARGLEFAHTHGVIHRDIKPANLLLDTTGVVKILDMGLARIDAADVATQADLTGTGAVMGTVDYMAPEQAVSTKTADARSDLYSLGISLWFLLTAKAAYEGDSLMSRLLAHRDQPIPSLRSVREDVSESLEAVFRKLVAKKPTERYQTAKELIADLEACRTGATVKALEVAEVATGADEFQDFLQMMDSPTSAGGKPVVGASMTATQTRVRAKALSSLSLDETMARSHVSDTLAPSLRVRKGGKPKSPPWFQNVKVLAGGGAAAVVLLLAVILLFSTSEGTLRVEILDPEVEVTVKGSKLVFQGSDIETVSLAAGDKKLLVTRGDLTFETESFTIKKGEETRVKVVFEDDQLKATSGKTLLGESPVRKKALTTSRTGDRPANSTKEFAGPSKIVPPTGTFGLHFAEADVVELPPQSSPQSVEVTCEMWFAADARATEPIANPSFFLWRSLLGELSVDTGKYRFYTFHRHVLSEMRWEPNRRVHLAGVNDKSRRLLFVNGKLVGTTEDAGQPFPDKTQNPMLIGGNRFIGTIEAVRISKVARYTEDFTPPIAFTADKDTFALYRFDEGQGDVLKDSSGNNRHGQIKGAKWVRLDGSAITAPQAVGTAQKKAPPLAVAPFDAQQARAHQEAWAKHLGVPVEYTNALGVKFVLIPPGEFLMGSGEQETKGALDSPPEGDADHYRNVRKWRASQTPQRRVRLTQPRYLGLHEVTQRQYEQVMGANPSEYAKTGPNKEIAGLVANLDTSNFPVDSVSWQEAIEFCNRLSEADHLSACFAREGDKTTWIDGIGYRLPSEAEWEFSCRAGTSTKFWSGNTQPDLNRAGWIGNPHPKSVGTLAANPFGLFDIHGNVYEWVYDAWDEARHDRIKDGAAIDPLVHQGGDRILRGGCQGSDTHSAASANRYVSYEAYRSRLFGFRVSLSVDAVRQALVAKSEAKTVWTPADGKLDLLPLVDVKRDTVAGDWERVTDGLTVKQSKDHQNTPRLQLPYQPPEEYDFEIEFTPKSGNGTVEQILSSQSRSFVWLLNSVLSAGTKAGFETIDGTMLNDRKDGTVMKPKLLENGPMRYRSRVEVRTGSVRGFLNDERLVDWGGQFTRLDINKRDALRDSLHLGLSANDRSVTFHKIEVREVTGTGRVMVGATLSENNTPWIDWLGQKLKRGDFKDNQDGWVVEGDAITTDRAVQGIGVLPSDTHDAAMRVTYLLRDSKGIQLGAREHHVGPTREFAYFAEDNGAKIQIATFGKGDAYKLLAEQAVPANISKDAPRTLEFRLVGERLTLTLNGTVVITAKDATRSEGLFAVAATKRLLIQKVEVQSLDDPAVGSPKP